MNFLNCSLDSPKDYKKFIKKHKYEKTKKEQWRECKNVIPYSESMVGDKDKEVYFEFVDDKLNFYVDFFNTKTKKWLESYKFKDKELCWTAFIDNVFYGNPLKINGETNFNELLGESNE
jgi:hypothetical protein